MLNSKLRIRADNTFRTVRTYFGEIANACYVPLPCVMKFCEKFEPGHWTWHECSVYTLRFYCSTQSQIEM